MKKHENPNIQSDYEFSRETYYQLLDKGKESLELMIEVARESEHPRAFEVLSNMMKQTADIADKLMDLNKKNKEIHKEELLSDARQITNNNVFLGSTTELQRFLLNKEKLIE
jgi:DNA-binding PadR family transcriptional regulator